MGLVLILSNGCNKNPLGDGTTKKASNDIFIITCHGNVYGYDWETLSLSSELNIGRNPGNIIYSNDGRNIFISSFSANSVSIIDANENTLIKTIHIDGEPNGVAFVAKSNRLYVSNITKNQIEVIDLDTCQIIAKIELIDSPYPLIASRSGDMVYTSTISGYFIAISTKDNNIKNSIKLEKEWLYSLALSSDDKFAYIASRSGNTIFIVDLADFSLNKTIANITKRPFPDGTIDDLVYSANSNLLYYCDLNSNYVGAIDLQQHKVINRIEVDRGPGDLDISPNGKYLFSLQFGAILMKPIPDSRRVMLNVRATMNVIEIESMTVIKKVALSTAGATGIAVDPTLDF
ncbi:MAG: YncE family protein [Candidatus Latescibacteria bacterium]|nr:YncE family protein [Candidatus Latescibacterota bacterium]